MTKKELALVDFEYFIEAYCRRKLWKCQKKWVQTVQACIDGDYRGLLLLAPADHGKTSRVVVPLILWLLARDRSCRIILVGNTDDYAAQIGRAVKSTIENNKDLREDFELRKGEKWADAEIIVDRPMVDGVPDEKPSLLCVGVGAEIQSQRADYLIADDMCTRRNSGTSGQRAAINTYWNTDLDSRLDSTPQGIDPTKNKKLVFGHRVEAQDQYSTMGDEEGWLYITDKAIIEEDPEPKPRPGDWLDGRVLAPEWHTYEKLCRKRAKDLPGFMLLYQQVGIEAGILITRASMEACWRKDLSFHQHLTADDRALYKLIWLELDPAFTKNRWSSHAVMLLMGLTHSGKRRLLWAWREKVLPETLLAMMEIRFRIFSPDWFIIEGNQAQTLLLTHMRAKFPDQRSKFVQFDTESKDNSLESNIGKLIELYHGPEPAMEIPYKGAVEQAFAHAQAEEFTGFPELSRRDCIMAQYIGEMALRLLKDETRQGHVDSVGIIGNIAQKYRRSLGFTRRSR